MIKLRHLKDKKAFKIEFGYANPLRTVEALEDLLLKYTKENNVLLKDI